jgi:Ser/Thr protein kinase RdoA (MazF antagonist)
MWLSALGRETDLLVPEPVPTPDGLLMDHVSYYPQHPGRYCCLLRWVPGEHKGAAGYAPADISLLGSYVAGLHNHAQSYQVPKGAAFPRWGWKRVFGKAVPLWSAGEAYYSAGEMEMFRAVAQRVREDLDRLGKGPEVFGLIHRDLSFDNVIFDGERVGAIDFDLCGHGHYPFDLAVVLHTVGRHHAAGHRGAGQLEQLRESLFEGYERARALPDAQRESIDSFDVLVRVGDVNRRLKLLSSEDTSSQDRQAILGFLRNVASWLRELSRKWE